MDEMDISKHGGDSPSIHSVALSAYAVTATTPSPAESDYATVESSPHNDTLGEPPRDEILS